jgi:hypothetical protein
MKMLFVLVSQPRTSVAFIGEYIQTELDIQGALMFQVTSMAVPTEHNELMTTMRTTRFIDTHPAVENTAACEGTVAQRCQAAAHHSNGLEYFSRFY